MICAGVGIIVGIVMDDGIRICIDTGVVICTGFGISLKCLATLVISKGHDNTYDRRLCMSLCLILYFHKEVQESAAWMISHVTEI